MIRALIFDWGGVIQRTEDPAPRQALDEELGLPPGGTERAVFESPIWQEASQGRRGADETWRTIAMGVGYPLEHVDEFVERFFAGDRIDQVLVEHIQFWRSQGYKAGLLSNAPPGRAASASAAGRWGMDGLFDAQVFSYQLGILKPAPRMYGAILAALDVSAEESLFIDDAPANIEGARAEGMLALRFVGLVPLIDELARLGLPLPKGRGISRATG